MIIRLAEPMVNVWYVAFTDIKSCHRSICKTEAISRPAQSAEVGQTRADFGNRSGQEVMKTDAVGDFDAEVDLTDINLRLIFEMAADASAVT